MLAALRINRAQFQQKTSPNIYTHFYLIVEITGFQRQDVFSMFIYYVEKNFNMRIVKNDQCDIIIVQNSILCSKCDFEKALILLF